jgi:hypothetical protein
MPAKHRSRPYAYITSLIRTERIPIGERLVRLVAQWADYMQGRTMSASTSDWHVRFLSWALRGRVAEFMEYLSSHPSADSERALCGIHQVYDFYWPQPVACKYVFHQLWGWLQVELKKPGVSGPTSLPEQRAVLERGAAKRGEKIIAWRVIAGGLFAETESDRS